MLTADSVRASSSPSAESLSDDEFGDLEQNIANGYDINHINLCLIYIYHMKILSPSVQVSLCIAAAERPFSAA